MQLTTIFHTVGVFLTVALATFIASDPSAVSAVWKAAIIAVIAGLAAVGITPPWATRPKSPQNQWPLTTTQQSQPPGSSMKPQSHELTGERATTVAPTSSLGSESSSS